MPRSLLSSRTLRERARALRESVSQDAKSKFSKFTGKRIQPKYVYVLPACAAFMMLSLALYVTVLHFSTPAPGKTRSINADVNVSIEKKPSWKPDHLHIDHEHHLNGDFLGQNRRKRKKDKKEKLESKIFLNQNTASISVSNDASIKSDSSSQLLTTSDIEITTADTPTLSPIIPSINDSPSIEPKNDKSESTKPKRDTSALLNQRVEIITAQLETPNRDSQKLEPNSEQKEQISEDALNIKSHSIPQDLDSQDADKKSSKNSQEPLFPLIKKKVNLDSVKVSMEWIFNQEGAEWKYNHMATIALIGPDELMVAWQRSRTEERQHDQHVCFSTSKLHRQLTRDQQTTRTWSEPTAIPGRRFGAQWSPALFTPPLPPPASNTEDSRTTPSVTPPRTTTTTLSTTTWLFYTESAACWWCESQLCNATMKSSEWRQRNSDIQLQRSGPHSAGGGTDSWVLQQQQPQHEFRHHHPSKQDITASLKSTRRRSLMTATSTSEAEKRRQLRREKKALAAKEKEEREFKFKDPVWSPGGDVMAMYFQGGVWSRPQLIHEEAPDGGEAIAVPKVIANPPIAMSWEHWVLPFWRETPRGEVMCPQPGGDTASVLITLDQGRSWKVQGDIKFSEPQELGKLKDWLIEGAVTTGAQEGSLIQLMRTSRNWTYMSTSADGGATWAEPQKTTLPNPNSKLSAVRLRSGALVCAYNHHEGMHKVRSNLFVSISYDDGDSWEILAKLETDMTFGSRYHYPSLLEIDEGTIFVVYTISTIDGKGGVKMATITFT